MKKYILAALIAMLGTACFAQLPAVQIKDIKGKTINTATLSNDGKPFCICFFASWCKPCNRELKAIHEVYEEWQEETGMKIYAVSIDQGQNSLKVKPFVDAEGWEYDILLDPNSEFLHALGIQLIPHTLVLDGEGKIQFRHTSYQDGAEEHIIKEVRELLAKPKQTQTQSEAALQTETQTQTETETQTETQPQTEEAQPQTEDAQPQTEDAQPADS